MNLIRCVVLGIILFAISERLCAQTSPVASASGSKTGSSPVTAAPPAKPAAVQSPVPEIASDSVIEGTFALDLADGDKLVSVEGSRKILAAWRRVVLAANRRVFVLLESLQRPFVEPLFELKQRRPEVDVTILCGQSGVNEIGARLLAEKIHVFFRADFKGIGASKSGRLTGLIAVCDSTSVLMATGEPDISRGDFGGDGEDAYIVGWVIDSTPLAEAYARVLRKQSELLVNLEKDESLLPMLSGK